MYLSELSHFIIQFGKKVKAEPQKKGNLGDLVFLGPFLAVQAEQVIAHELIKSAV